MPLVAIVGRPNVGKSTLFNRLTESQQAIVHDESGVTRDRVFGTVNWNGRDFDIMDTGGYVPNSADRFEAAIREQVVLAIEEADVILFVADVMVGATDLDEAVASLLRKSEKPVLIVANKADNVERRWGASEFYNFGVGEVYPLSSINGSGTGELLDDLVEALPEEKEPEEDGRLRIALIGRPNVGKSSLTNAFLGEERSIVTEISGTTRDALDADFMFQGREVVLVDTAGLRKRARIKENVEFYAAVRTERAIQGCDVAILLVDATQGFEAQDIRVLRQAEGMKKGLVLAINKWDLMTKDTNTIRDMENAIRERVGTLSYAPIVFVSALTKQRIHKLMEIAVAVADERKKRVPTSELNDFLREVVERHRPPMYRNRPVKINFATQVREDPPVIAFFCNQPKGVREPYRRYLENRFRERFGFEGVPLTMVFKPKR